MSRTPIRALIASSRCGSVTPGSPMTAGVVTPSARRAASQARDLRGIEAELRGHPGGIRQLRAERVEQGSVRDRRRAHRGSTGMPIAAGTGPTSCDRPQQRQPVRVRARRSASPPTTKARRQARPAAAAPEGRRGAPRRGPCAPRGAARREIRAAWRSAARSNVASRPLPGEAVTDTWAPGGSASICAATSFSGSSSNVGVASSRARAARSGASTVRAAREQVSPRAAMTDSRQTFESGNDALRCVMKSTQRLVDAGSIGGASYSASVRFQIALARCAASSAPASSHCS